MAALEGMIPRGYTRYTAHSTYSILVCRCGHRTVKWTAKPKESKESCEHDNMIVDHWVDPLKCPRLIALFEVRL